MEEINVGEFIRTKEPYGDIYKVIGREQENILLVDSLGNNRVETGYVSKHSPNIIDLIEVGDYVNGVQVVQNENGTIYAGLCLDCDYYEEIISNPKAIENIVTKEQFNSIKYTVGE